MTRSLGVKGERQIRCLCVHRCHMSQLRVWPCSVRTFAHHALSTKRASAYVEDLTSASLAHNDDGESINSLSMRCLSCDESREQSSLDLQNCWQQRLKALYTYLYVCIYMYTYIICRNISSKHAQQKCRIAVLMGHYSQECCCMSYDATGTDRASGNLVTTSQKIT